MDNGLRIHVYKTIKLNRPRLNINIHVTAVVLFQYYLALCVVFLDCWGENLHVIMFVTYSLYVYIQEYFNIICRL